MICGWREIARNGGNPQSCAATGGTPHQLPGC